MSRGCVVMGSSLFSELTMGAFDPTRRPASMTLRVRKAEPFGKKGEAAEGPFTRKKHINISLCVLAGPGLACYKALRDACAGCRNVRLCAGCRPADGAEHLTFTRGARQ